MNLSKEIVKKYKSYSRWSSRQSDTIKIILILMEGLLLIPFFWLFLNSTFCKKWDKLQNEIWQELESETKGLI